MAGFGMAAGAEWRRRLGVWADRRAPVAEGFCRPPQPRSIGCAARGRQLVGGSFAFTSQVVMAPGQALWDIGPKDAALDAEAQGFGWLDDLAALGDAAARARAQDWTQGWIARFGTGKGPGWAPGLTGRRVTRWLHHAQFLLHGADPDFAKAWWASILVQTRALVRVWRRAEPGLPQLEALTGLTLASLSLKGMDALTDPALAALTAEAARLVDAEGGIPSRNPEELAEVFALLTWVALALADAGGPEPVGLHAALGLIAPALRTLRHADGGLARFHGGGRGVGGRVDHALAGSGVKPGVPSGLAMGYARLSAGRVTLIMDAAAPPGGAAALRAHASTLGFEMTSGRRPLIVNCGSGLPFGAEWRRAGRATPSHSTLAIDGVSSSRFGRGQGDRLSDRAAVLTLRQTRAEDGKSVHAAHDGWAMTHGLSHARDLMLSGDGSSLTGTDTLIALNPRGRARFDRVLAGAGPEGVAFSIRFHLHPDAEARLDTGGIAVVITLKSGETWVFSHDGQAHLSLDPSVHMEWGGPRPRPTRQIVLSAHAGAGETSIGWTLAKPQGNPRAIRDLAPDESPAAPSP